MNCLHNALNRTLAYMARPAILTPQVRSYGTLFQVHSQGQKIFQHYIGTDDDKEVSIPLGCSFELVPRTLFAKTVKGFLREWDTERLASSQVLQELAIWQIFLCNHNHPTRGANQISLKRCMWKTYSVKIIGENTKDLLYDWRKELLIPGKIPLLPVNASDVKDLPFIWAKYESLHCRELIRPIVYIRWEDSKRRLERKNFWAADPTFMYKTLYNLHGSLNPFLAMSLCFSDVVNEIQVSVPNENGSQKITITASGLYADSVY